LSPSSTARQELKLRNRTTKVSRRRAKAGGSRCWARQPACVQPRRSLRPSYSPSPKGESFASCRASPAGCRSQTRGATKAAGLPTPPLWRWTESAGASTQQDSSAASRRQKAASASPQRRQSNPPVQRRSRDAGTETYESTEGPPPRLRGRLVPWEAEMGAPQAAEQFEDRPRRWWRRRGGFVFFDRGAGED
jgi:hypothetical protein